MQLMSAFSSNGDLVDKWLECIDELVRLACQTAYNLDVNAYTLLNESSLGDQQKRKLKKKMTVAVTGTSTGSRSSIVGSSISAASPVRNRYSLAHLTQYTGGASFNTYDQQQQQQQQQLQRSHTNLLQTQQQQQQQTQAQHPPQHLDIHPDSRTTTRTPSEAAPNPSSILAALNAPPSSTLPQTIPTTATPTASAITTTPDLPTAATASVGKSLLTRQRK